MRAVWCFLLLLTVLAPAGSVGITAAPAEAETVLTAPRATTSASIERRDPIVAAAPIAPAFASEPRVVAAPAPAPARPLLSSSVATAANPRAPPA